MLCQSIHFTSSYKRTTPSHGCLFKTLNKCAKKKTERKFQTLCKTNFLSRVSVFILAAMTRSCASDRIQQKLLTWTKSSIFSKVSVAGWVFFSSKLALWFLHRRLPTIHTHTHHQWFHVYDVVLEVVLVGVNTTAMKP